MTPPLLVALVGPTASGKSALALHLAEALAGEVVSCDALQLRQGLPILMAKPTQAERERVPHHLIDVLPLTQAGTAARYTELADAVIAELRRRQRTVILCGGTGLYLRALTRGLFQGPPANPAFRQALRAEAQVEGAPALHARLQQVDPVAAMRIAPADYVRIERALEVFAATQIPISRLQAESQAQGPRYRVLGIGLDPGVDALRTRIWSRAAQMIKEGVVAEVAAVAARHPDLLYPPLGYELVLRHLAGSLALPALTQELAVLTTHYARRQRTWFRKEPDLRWFRSAEQIPIDALRRALASQYDEGARDPAAQDEALRAWQRG